MGKLEVTLDLSGVSEDVVCKLRVLDDIGLLDSYVLNTLVKEMSVLGGKSVASYDVKDTYEEPLKDSVETHKYDEDVKSKEYDVGDSFESKSSVGGKIYIKGKSERAEEGGRKVDEDKSENKDDGETYDQRALDFINNMMSM